MYSNGTSFQFVTDRNTFYKCAIYRRFKLDLDVTKKRHELSFEKQKTNNSFDIVDQ